MFNNDEGYPKETSYEYIYDLNNIESHSEMILGEKDSNLISKLRSFGYENKVCSNLNYLDYYTGDGVKDFSEYITLRNYGFGFLGDSIENKYADSQYSYLVGTREVGVIFGFEPRPGAIMITQSQGVKGYGDVWRNFRYTDYCIDLLEEEFKDFNIPELWVLPVKRNHYARKWSERELKIKERFYDKAAKRNGFSFDEKKGLWVKKNN